MGPRGRVALWAGAFLTLFAASAYALDSVEQVEDCVRENLPETSSKQTIRITAVDAMGSETGYEAKILWRRFSDDRAKSVIRVFAPSDVRGTAVLMVDRGDERVDIFAYLPELRKVRRVTKHSVAGSFLGTDFTYEDLERVQGQAQDSERRLLEPKELDGHRSYVIESTPKEEGSAYRRVVAYVDQELCLPMRVELYRSGEKPAKLMTLQRDAITKEKSGHVPRRVLVEDLEEGSRSELVVDEIEFDGDIPEREFSVSALERHR